jgi:hypothetical protein
MVPRQVGTGGKVTLGKISKRGDTYLRALLIHGARSAILAAQRKSNCRSLVNRSASPAPTEHRGGRAGEQERTHRVALLAHEREFRPDYIPATPLA